MFIIECLIQIIWILISPLHASYILDSPNKIEIPICLSNSSVMMIVYILMKACLISTRKLFFI